MDHSIVDDNAILEIQCGSHLYGTSVPTSDVDYVGVFIAPKQYYIGMERVEEVDRSLISKGDDGKNDKDAIDRKFYELRNFLNLAKGGNPNIVEILFVNDANVISCNAFGQHLRENAGLFVSQAVRPKYLGYSLGQKKMMVNKPDNFAQTVAAFEWIEKKIEQGLNPKQRVAAVLFHMVVDKVAEDKLTHISIGKANYCTSMTIKKLHAALHEKLAKITNRQELWKKFAYDVKFAAHLIRLLTEGIEIMTTGRIQFPLQNRDLLLSIRNGGYTKEEVLEMAEGLEVELKDLNSDLPMETDFHKINNLLMSMVEESWM
jgi:predicted nucleotidyltransferase